jgi:hypothetical protein
MAVHLGGMMDGSSDVLRLLEEIRDNQRTQLAESQRISQDYLELNRLATEANRQGYQKSIESFRSFLRGTYILIALTLAANLWILVRLAGLR